MIQRYKYPKFFNNLEEYSENNYLYIKEYSYGDTNIFSENYKNGYRIVFRFDKITNKKVKEMYYKNDEIHCIVRPAVLHFNNKGKLIESNWVYNGRFKETLVSDWLKTNKRNWIHMNENDFNRMWMEIL